MTICLSKKFVDFTVFLLLSTVVVCAENHEKDIFDGAKTINKMNGESYKDGDVTFFYRLNKNDQFISLEICYKDITVFKYTELEPEGARYYGDPRSGLSATVQFSKPRIVIGINLTGVSLRLSKSYTWDPKTLRFFPVPYDGK